MRFLVLVLFLLAAAFLEVASAGLIRRNKANDDAKESASQTKEDISYWSRFLAEESSMVLPTRAPTPAPTPPPTQAPVPESTPAPTPPPTPGSTPEPTQTPPVVFNVTVIGSDAIFLAGRTDVVIPPASEPWTGPGTHLIRHSGPTPEETQETVPPFLSITGGDILRVADPAVGGVNFFNGFGPPFFGPSGNGVGGSNLQPLDGISGYQGPQGPLTGVFLDDSIPSSGPAPATLDFSPSGVGLDFATIAPELGQIFYIGDGITSGNVLQEFVAPAGATRVFIGIPDGFFFGGPPGAYDDNDGSYMMCVGINKAP